MPQLQLPVLLDSLREHHAVVRQTSALFVKNVLVAWRNRWATGLRLLAPLMFLAMALMVQEVMNMNARRTGRTRDIPTTVPESISSIPGCSSELFIYNKPCLDFIFTPKDDARVQAIVTGVRQNNDPPIPADRVMGFSTRSEADDFMQSRQKYVLGAVHFIESPSKQLQYIIQSNTSIPTFKGYVQSPNDFFQMPFMSAIAREISRSYLEAAGMTEQAAGLQWQPKLALFPHPQLSPGTAGYILPPFIFVACMFATISFLAVVVSEKESGLRQALQTMGLQQGSYWLSWWLFEAVMAAITAWCLIGFGAALQLPMFIANNVMLQFFLFWLFGMAMTSFACCTSVFLSTSQSAGNAGLAMILVGWICQALASIGMPYSPTIFYTKNGMGKAFFWIFALFPWNPLTKGVLDMSAAAANPSQHGLRFGERSTYCKYVPDPTRAAGGADMSWLYQDNNCIFSIGQCYWVLVVQTIVWMLAAVYFDNVQPNRHGVRLPLWYPLLPAYWMNMFKSGASALRTGRQPTIPAASNTRAGSQGGAKHTPFAIPDAARKVAKAISDVKEDEQLVIRCTSSAGGGGLDVITARGHGFAAPTQGSTASVARQSVSSGMLRRRDNRNSAAGTPDFVSVGGRDSFAGDLGALPSRSIAAGSSIGRLPPFSGHQHSAHSAQLMINSSVTVLQLSESSSDVMHAVHASTGAAAVHSAAAPGTTISLQQYQQMQEESRRCAAATRRWWEFWRVGEDSLTLAAKKHDSMVAAAAAAGPPASTVLQSKEPLSAYGVTPVVLDTGVLQEEQRMKAALYGEASGTWTSKQDLIQVFGLRKVYNLPGGRKWWHFWHRTQPRQQQQQQQQEKKQYVAVVDSWFGVPKGQLLCLLGPNGAGKTTTINCLIGALPPSGGDVRVMGHSLLAADGLEVAQGVMGVCPQFDVLWDELTGKEHMYIYGCIKGLPSSEVVEKGSDLLEQVQLTAAANKRSSSYSGGMKRRLSVALALLGSPQLVFLDEPSTGMDPISRRAVWDAINAAKQQAAVVLTTHSMEEADALGDRIAIMVRGRMRVLGGSLTLKQKYGNGYQLRLRLLHNQPQQCLLLDQYQQRQRQQQLDQQQCLNGQRLTHRGSGMTGVLHGHDPKPSCPCLPMSPKAGQETDTYFSVDSAGGSASPRSRPDSGVASANSRGGSTAAGVMADSDGGRPFSSTAPVVGGGAHVLQKLVALRLGLAPTEEGKQMLHYVIPQTLGPELQCLLELLDPPDRQRQLGLAEVHVSLATLEEVFLTVVKQAEQDYAAMHGQTVVVELPTGQQLELPVGQEVAADNTTGLVYAVDWVQDEWGRLAVAGVRQMEAAEQSAYWRSKHLAQ